MSAYYADDSVTLWHGDMRTILPTLAEVDAIVTDPPYGETALAWDRWPTGWPAYATAAAKSMWCFGSMRMFLDQRDEFQSWTYSQDIVWEKHNGSGMRTDRFRRIHEHATFWYQGAWASTYREPIREATGRDPRSARSKVGRRPAHLEYDGRPPLNPQGWVDDGTRLVSSVIRVRSMHMRALHPTEKPVGILDPLIRYACPPGGTVLDPFAGSGSTAVAARLSGRKAVLVEADERYCEVIANRLAQDCLPVGAA